MGADMLVMGIPEFNVTDSRIQQLYDVVGNATDIMSGDHFGGDDLDEWKSYMIAAISEMPDFGCSREVTGISIEGAKYPVWVSGGMSWGDDPTEVFYGMSAIVNCEPIWAMIRKWAIEDHTVFYSTETLPVVVEQPSGEPDEKELRRRRDKLLRKSLGY